MKKIRLFLIENAVPIIFIVLIAIAIPESGLPGKYLLQEILTRLGCNSLLVISLLLPIIAGMGLNFGMVLGAMAGQIGLIFAMDWRIIGIPGFLLAALISLPISILLGLMCGYIMNKAKGREMVTGFILGGFMSSIYMLFVEFAMGTIIPVLNPKMLLSHGYGLNKTIGLESMRKATESLIPLNIGGLNIPIFNYLLITVVCVFIIWLKKTKLGQDMRAVGQDSAVARSAGIAVDKTRIIAIIISTVLAGFGQIIFLQNLGTINTTNSHEQIWLFSIATLLIGGASVTKASIPNAILGVILFHLLFLVAPLAGKNLTGSDALSGYLMPLITYMVSLLALVLHEWKRSTQEKRTKLLYEDGAIAGYDKEGFGLFQAFFAVYLLILFLKAPAGSLPGAFSVIFTRIGMNGVLVLSLLPMIQSGCGLNFGLPLGIIAGLLGATFSIEIGYIGAFGFLFAIIVSQVLGAIFGLGYGTLLNRAKGGEMMIAYYVGFSSVILMSIAWLALPYTNPVMAGSYGGLRSTITVEGYWRRILDDFLTFQIADFKFPTGSILFFLLTSFVVWAFLSSKNEHAITNVNRSRVTSVVISTMLGAMGIIVYQQSYGFIQLFLAPQYMVIPTVAAILIGGAGINKASLTNVFIGISLYQGIITMTPLVFNEVPKPVMSEVSNIVLGSVATNGMILYALTRKTKVLK
jgi:simple sugar transport system permease protein